MNEIITIKRLNAIDRVLDDNIISYKLGMLYYINKNYSAALTYLSNFTEAHNPSEENLWYALADIYYNLKNYELSIEFSTKITPKSINYFPAQEILYNNYIAQNNIQKARECAKILLQYAPTATNYVRLGNTIQNSDTEKLNLYNRARELALEENDIKTLALADTGIAILEQNKIDNAVKTLTGFVEKPSWQKILEEIGAITEPIELSTRQANFFKSTNYCIKNFNNQDLIKCFEYVNREEAKISNEKLSEYQKEYEAQQQEYELMRRQQEFLERTYYNRMYMDEFLYMRDPYHYYW